MRSDTQRDALEKLRVRLNLPEGGMWNYNLTHDRWMYQYATGPNTFTVMAGTSKPDAESPA